jgi:signal peptidase II
MEAADKRGLRNWTRTIAIAAAVVCTIGCDRVTKHLATRELIDSPRRSYFGDTLRVEYVENVGGFLGLGSTLPAWARTVVFTLGTGAVLAFVTFAAGRQAHSAVTMLGLAFLWAGGVSNLADRVARGGRVVDFLNVGVGPLRTGIFNVADMAIMLGVALVLLTGRKPPGRV